MTAKKSAKHSKRKPKRRASSFKKKYVAPKTVKEFHRMPTKLLQIYMMVLNLVGLVREGSLLTSAMRKLGLNRPQVDGFGGSALRKQKNGRYVAKAYDRLLRVVRVVSNGGLREVGTRDSRQASKAAKHSNAVHRYLATGDDSALLQFEGMYVVDLNGERIPLLTDLEELDELGGAGVISFETIYARS